MDIMDVENCDLFVPVETMEPGMEPQPATEGNNDIYVLTAAIDFGTTFSGYAFSFRTSRDTIHMNMNWGASLGCQSYKAPTCVLTDASNEFVAFGFDAEERYSQYLGEKNGDVKKYQMYRHFKMLLHKDKSISRSTKITSETGHRTLALDVFSMAIKYLKDHLLQRINDMVDSNADATHVRWVLTVPAIWGDSAKQFMREAAFKAGCITEKNSDQLILALEPEAASVFCKKIDIKGYVSDGGLNDLNFEPNTKYLVIDAGGGTVDISAHEVIDDESVRELYVANGGPWGGIEVDKKFILLLNELFGAGFVNKFKRDQPATFLHFMTLFEKAKKQICIEDKESKICLQLPWELGNMITQHFHTNNLASAINNRNVPGITFANGSVVIDHERSLSLFTENITNMMDHVGKLLRSPKLQGLSYVMLVGGFGDCKVLQHSLKEKLPSGVKMLVPAEAQLAIVKGAVYYGYNQMAIISRIMDKTYGTDTMRRFNPDIHEEKRKKKLGGGVAWCDDLFRVFVEKGDSVEVGTVINERRTPVYDKQPGMMIDMYSTEKDNLDEVVYVDSPYMHRLCGIYVEMPNVENNFDREVRLEIQFGGTEIKVKATDGDSGKTAETAIDFLYH